MLHMQAVGIDVFRDEDSENVVRVPQLNDSVIMIVWPNPLYFVDIPLH